jgi:hypothetical protein
MESAMSNLSLARIMYGSSEEARVGQWKPAAWATQAANAEITVQRVNESAIEKLWHKAWSALSTK